MGVRIVKVNTTEKELKQNEMDYLGALGNYPPEYHRLDEWAVEVLGLGPAIMEILREINRENILDEINWQKIIIARYCDELNEVIKKREEKKGN